MEVGGVYTYRYTVTTRMTCIKMGSDESRFNVLLIVRDKVTRPCPQTTTVEEKGEPKPYRTEVLRIRLPAYRLTARPNQLSCLNGEDCSRCGDSVRKCESDIIIIIIIIIS